jgi:MFS family permease
MNIGQKQYLQPHLAASAWKESTADATYPRPAYAWYVVSVLTVAYIFSFIDRQILNLLVVPIQEDLNLSDTQIGLLQGIAFALFYTLMGIPIGRLADRSSRRMIIGIGVVCWSLMTMSCGLARSFLTLFLARIGVGVGEATLSPSAYSLISDYFPPNKVTRAIGVYAGGSFIGAGLAYIVGGFVLQFIVTVDSTYIPWVGELQTWQAAFIIVGLPGLLFALLMLTIREPKRLGNIIGPDNSESVAVTIREAIAFLTRHKRAYSFHFLGYSMITLVAYAVLAWMPTYFIRNFGRSPGEIGLVYGAIVLICGTAGVVGAGWLADIVRAKGFKDANLRIIMVGALVLVPFVVGETLVAHEAFALVLVAIATLIWSMPHGVGPAALMTITPNQLRSQVSALYLFMLNTIGLSLGPLSVGLLTDYFFGDPIKVGQSLAIVTGLGSLLAAFFLWLGLRPYNDAVELAEHGWVEK